MKTKYMYKKMWLELQCKCLRAVFTWLSKGIGFGFGFGFGFTTPFGWLVCLLWFWFYDSQVKTALFLSVLIYIAMKLNMFYICLHVTLYMNVK